VAGPQPKAGQALTRLLVAVRDELADLGRGELVLTACSGGPDSLALAAATARLAAARGWRTGAVVVDHGWSAESSQAGRDAVAVLTGLGLDPVELAVVACLPGGGPEASARTARYQALDEAAQRLGAAAVVLGHTLDDQAESVLLGLGRGSGGRSLAGMPRRRGRYRRPLLGLRRTEVLAACDSLELSPWLDPANDDPRYSRVRIRRLAQQLEHALGPGAAQNLARTADLLREDSEALELAADDLLARALLIPDQPVSDQPGLDVAVLLSAPVAVRRRALLAAARAAGCPPGGLTRAHALALDGLLVAAEGAQAHLPAGVIASRMCGRLQLAADA
jgi:tRNA(Ile)-lysidine synthase